MTWRERTIVFVAVVTAAALLFLLPFGRRSYQGPAAWAGTPTFAPSRAWTEMETLAVTFPRRWSGGPDRRAAADWLAARLTQLGFVVHRDTFPMALGRDAPVVLENVWGVLKGMERPDEIILALGNYDMASTSFQAASDTAGHVGVLLELARVMAAEPPQRTIVFFFPDGEEWGMLGARRFAQTFPDRRKIVAALSIEDLDTGNFRALGIDGIGQFRGYAPMWLRALAANGAVREGFPVEDVDPLSEWLQRSVLVSFTDQGPFLGAGIPAIDLSGNGDDAALQDAVYHLPGDTVEKMRPEALGAYGRIMERILRAIDAMQVIPRESDFYLRLGSGVIVSPSGLLASQLAVFVPLLVALLFRGRQAALTGAALVDESVRMVALLGVLLVGLAGIKLMPVLKLMPDYELYPAAPRHPLLTDVYWSPVLLCALVVAAAGLTMWRLIRGIGPGQSWNRAAGIAAGLLWLLLVSIVTLLDSPFGAVTFLLLPVMIWIWIEPASSPGGRLAVVLWVGLGFLVTIALFARYAAILGIGPYVLWYVFMSLAYGQFSLLRVVAALATVGIGLRLVAVGAFHR